MGLAHRLRADGVLLPGDERRDHLWASRVVREDPNLDGAPSGPDLLGPAGRRAGATGTATGCSATSSSPPPPPRQAARLVADLAPAEVHLVVTAREPLGLFTASWQESLKNRSTTPLADYSRTESGSPTVIWNWRTLDLRLVLRRWAPRRSAPSGSTCCRWTPAAPARPIWQPFAGLLGLARPGLRPRARSPTSRWASSRRRRCGG